MPWRLPVDDFDEVADGLVLVHTADVDLHCQRGSIEANRILDIHRDSLIGEFL